MAKHSLNYTRSIRMIATHLPLPFISLSGIVTVSIGIATGRMQPRQSDGRILEGISHYFVGSCNA